MYGPKLKISDLIKLYGGRYHSLQPRLKLSSFSHAPGQTTPQDKSVKTTTWDKVFSLPDPPEDDDYPHFERKFNPQYLKPEDGVLHLDPTFNPAYKVNDNPGKIITSSNRSLRNFRLDKDNEISRILSKSSDIFSSFFPSEESANGILSSLENSWHPSVNASRSSGLLDKIEKAGTSSPPKPAPIGGTTSAKPQKGLFDRIKEISLAEPDYPTYQGDERLLEGSAELQRQNRLANQEYNRTWGDMSPIEIWREALRGNIPDQPPESEGSLLERLTNAKAESGWTADKTNTSQKQFYQNLLAKGLGMEADQQYRRDVNQANREAQIERAKYESDADKYKADVKSQQEQYDKNVELLAGISDARNKWKSDRVREIIQKSGGKTDPQTAWQEAEIMAQKFFDPDFDRTLRNILNQ